MKKLFLIVLASVGVLVAPAYAQQNAEQAIKEKTKVLANHLAAAAANAAAKETNANAIGDNITVSTRFAGFFVLNGDKDGAEEHVYAAYALRTYPDLTEQEKAEYEFILSGTMASVLPANALATCKAYALNRHWLITSKQCADPFYNEEDVIGVYTAKRQVQGNFLQLDDMFTNDHIALIYSEKKLDISNGPMKVMAFSNPVDIFALPEATFKVNTARFGLDKVVDRKLVKTDTLKNGLVSLNEKRLQLSGTATDPLVYIEGKNEYIVGFNNAPLELKFQVPSEGDGQSDGKTSPDYMILGEQDLAFIKDTVNKKDQLSWEKIKSRLFLNSSEKPYFEN